MSLLKIIKAQLGISSTPTNNFTLDASAQDGTMKLSRGNAGATTQDVMAVDAAGKVTFPAGSQMLGVGQTWAPFSRSQSQDYVNETGRPISVAVTSVSTNPATASILTVNGVKISQASGGGTGWGLNVSGVVPAGATYRVQNVNANIETWAELR